MPPFGNAVLQVGLEGAEIGRRDIWIGRQIVLCREGGVRMAAFPPAVLGVVPIRVDTGRVDVGILRAVEHDVDEWRRVGLVHGSIAEVQMADAGDIVRGSVGSESSPL